MVRQLVILVGGRGTRLGGLTETTPKPLLPVGGRPFLDQLVDRAACFGFEEVLLLSGYRSQDVRRYTEQRVGLPVPLVVIEEPVPAGTAGALLYARDRLADVFMMMNGDSLFETNWLRVTTALGPSDVGALALRDVTDAGRYGGVTLVGDRVVGFHEKTSTASAGLINAGVYSLRRSVLDGISSQPCSLEHEIFPALAATDRLVGTVLSGSFIDIGIPKDLLQAQSVVPAWRRRPAVLVAEALLPAAASLVRTLNDLIYHVILVAEDPGLSRRRSNRFLLARGAHVDAAMTPAEVDALPPQPTDIAGLPVGETPQVVFGPVQRAPGIALVLSTDDLATLGRVFDDISVSASYQRSESHA